MTRPTCECIGWQPDGNYYLRTGDTSAFYGCTHCRDNYCCPECGNGCHAEPTVETPDAWLCEDCAKADVIPAKGEKVKP